MGTTALRRRLPAFAAGLATLAMALGSTALPAGAAPPIKDVDLIAVGDSYTAGIGAGPATPTPCTQTDNGYVNLLINELPIVDKDSINAACAGALLDGPPSAVPSVLQQIAALAASGDLSVRTELVTVTAGANDINFTAPLSACALLTPEACAQEIEAVKAKFPAMQADLVEALTAIRKAAPHATIAVFSYPLLFDPYGLPTLLSQDAQKLVNEGTRALNSAIAQATNAPRVKAKAVYVDVTEAFKGHATNSEESWIFFEPPTFDANGAPIFDPRNFHPTADGHRAYKDVLQKSLDLQKLARP